MKVPASALPAGSSSAACRDRRPGRSGFALVVTLLILALLIVVIISFLSSMSNERMTANAYTAKARADLAAQAGVEAAESILTQSFRDFPDSVTVWDPNQSVNTGTPAGSEAGTTVNTQFNAGTSLYLHAVPQTQTVNGNAGITVANPNPNPPKNGQPQAADDPAGNNPNNLSCQTFVLPLISGVPGGFAQLASQAVSTGSTPNAGSILPKFDLTETDPAKQTSSSKVYCTDLNVRRGAGDVQGAIGSPADWASTNPKGPKPARALWVNLKDANGLVTGRYAFWIDDESFRANNNYLSAGNATTTRVDNSARPIPPGSTLPRSLQPSDMMLFGPLHFIEPFINIDDNTAGSDALAIFTARGNYPGSFFPDPLAFAHATNPVDGSSLTTKTLDALRYLTTTQSGTLNLTRHGTQRLNLNRVVPWTDPNTIVGTGTMQTQINQIVQTMQFHLPYFGERFYRQTTDAKANTLNSTTQVPGSPKTIPYTAGPTTNTDPSEIYYYKVAANIRDYLDTDTQPTIIDVGGTVRGQTKPSVALNHSEGVNEIWAQGKEISPYLQEAAVRLRVNVTPAAGDPNYPYRFTLFRDYYLEFWNMSDRDVYAHQQDNDPTLPNLHDATLIVASPNTWELSKSYGSVPTDDATDPVRLSTDTTLNDENDYEIDLTHDVQMNGSSGTPVPGGVVFKANSVTVITTDPDCANYVFVAPHNQQGPSSSITSPSTNPSVTYYCPHLLNDRGRRQYTGRIPLGTTALPNYGLQPFLRNDNHYYDYQTNVTLCNNYGYLDSSPSAIDYNGKTSTWYSDPATDKSYHDYSYSSSLMGNANTTAAGLYFPAIPSQLGDPRTNNEQMTVRLYLSPGNGDQSHYIYNTGRNVTLGYLNTSQMPDVVGATGTTGFPWPDYYSMAPYSSNVPATPIPINAPMVIADGPLTSIGQLGDVFDPARLPGTAGIAMSRGGGRTFKIGQRDDRYCGDPSGNSGANTTVDAVPASNAWAAWRLTDVFGVDDPIELPARININGILRDGGAALLSLLQGFVFQPTTNSTDPVIHGDGHGTAGIASKALNINGYTQLITQITARLTNHTPTNTSGGPYVPAGPFFERGEFGEIGESTNAIFGMSDPLGTTTSGTSISLVSGVDTYKTFDHSREELFRRISELICTRGDTFTAYVVGQSIQQTSTTAPMNITGTQRMRVTFRLIPMFQDGTPFLYTINSQAHPAVPADVIASNRFLKPDHYVAQVLSINPY